MNKKEQRSIVKQIRFTPTEAAQIDAWCEESKLDPSDYLRRVILQGITFRVEINAPERYVVQSSHIERVEDPEVQSRKKHAS